MNNTFWTEQRIATLQTLWADGFSARRIGRELGCTRNAVIGKLHRLKAPPPVPKQPIERGRPARRDPVIVKANAKARQDRYLSKHKAQVRAQFRMNGASPYSAAYRKHLPMLPDMTKGELRAMLSTAVQNTAAMQ